MWGSAQCPQVARDHLSVSSELLFVGLLSIWVKVPLISRICKFHLSQSLLPSLWRSMMSLRQLWFKALQDSYYCIFRGYPILRSLWTPLLNNSDCSPRHSAANITTHDSRELSHNNVLWMRIRKNIFVCRNTSTHFRICWVHQKVR